MSQFELSSYYSKGVEETNREMGYHDLANLANRDKEPAEMEAAKVNKQEDFHHLEPGYNPSHDVD